VIQAVAGFPVGWAADSPIPWVDGVGGAWEGGGSLAVDAETVPVLAVRRVCRPIRECAVIVFVPDEGLAVCLAASNELSRTENPSRPTR
jgi:hypothetical protein